MLTVYHVTNEKWSNVSEGCKKVELTGLGADTFLGGADGAVGLTVVTATEKNESRHVTKTLVAYIRHNAIDRPR